MPPRFEDQTRIFSRDGIWIDQVRTAADRAWTITTETSANFSISVYDPKCNPFTLNFGNLVLIENSDGLLPWVGMIDNVSFDGGKCFVVAYTPERFFFYRRGPRRLTLKGNAGVLFTQMISYVNGIEPTVIEVGQIDSNTNAMQETLNPVILSNNLKRIVARSGEGYRWRPEVRRGKLVIFADWMPSLTLDTGLLLQDGYNITGNHPFNYAPPVNDYLTYGRGASWDNRIISESNDDLSIQAYGLRQASASVNTDDVDTLQVASETFLNKRKYPAPSFPIAALNKDDTFSRLQPGALATFTKLVGQGFTSNGLGYLSYSRIVRSMVYTPSDGTVGLAV